MGRERYGPTDTYHYTIGSNDEFSADIPGLLVANITTGGITPTLKMVGSNIQRISDGEIFYNNASVIDYPNPSSTLTDPYPVKAFSENSYVLHYDDGVTQDSRTYQYYSNTATTITFKRV